MARDQKGLWTHDNLNCSGSQTIYSEYQSIDSQMQSHEVQHQGARISGGSSCCVTKWQGIHGRVAKRGQKEMGGNEPIPREPHSWPSCPKGPISQHCHNSTSKSSDEHLMFCMGSGAKWEALDESW